MVSEGIGRLFRRKDGKYLIYLTKDFAGDSRFPFRESDSIFAKVSFKPGGGKKLLVEKWAPPLEEKESYLRPNGSESSLVRLSSAFNC